MPLPEGIEGGTRSGIPGSRPVRPDTSLEAALSEAEKKRYEALLGMPAPARAPRGAEAPTALVVDDEPKFRQLLASILKEWGFNVADTPDGATALKALAAHNFDFLVSDLKLQGIDGYELVRGARSFLKIKDTFVVVFSAFADPLEEASALNVGADLFFRKPCVRELMIARLKPVVRRILDRVHP